MRLEKAHWSDPSGRQRQWEFASRTTRVQGQQADGVGVAAILTSGGVGGGGGGEDRKSGKKELLLVRQFRPPVGKHTIEFVAGLIEAGWLQMFIQFTCKLVLFT